MTQSSISIRRADLSEIIHLRHVILRAGLPREEAIFGGDELPDSRHYAAATNGHDGSAPVIVACATLHLNTWADAPAWQLRGMATDPSIRKTGVGAALLRFMETDLNEHPVRQLWCNARVPAIGFYRRMGWMVVSDIFEIPTAGPHVRMVKQLPSRDE
jgi:N-acetylglutamate synthase-like GNAT family acetyltransferase